MKKKILYVIGGIVAFPIILIILFSGNEPTPAKPVEQAKVAQPEQAAPAQASTETNDKQKAQEELDAIIALSKQAGVVSSYEFSETANVVYVTDVWYSLDVSFKKDLMGKIASLKETITGYHRFEVRNAKSNEKVGEVTAFSGSIEVYK